MPDVMEKQRELEQHISALSDDRMPGLVEYAERLVRMIRPNAKLLYTTDRRGTVTGLAIYDVTLYLNERGQFRPIKQAAPQRLSEHLDYKDNYLERAKARLRFNVWSDAYARLTALADVK